MSKPIEIDLTNQGDRAPAFGTALSSADADQAASRLAPDGLQSAGAAMLDIHAAMEAEFNRAAGTEGWRLMDTPKMAPEFMDQLVERCGGDEHVRWMVGSRGSCRIVGGKSEPCAEWVRASLLISPEGCRLARESIASADTRPQDEDPLGASLASGAVGEAETPNG